MNALEQAKASIRATLGLSDNPSDWSYDERLAYNRALAIFIAGNPNSFPASAINSANSVLNENNSALSDTGFLSDLSTFGEAFTDEAINAGNSVAGIGNGFLNLAGMAKWLIPIAGIAVLGILLWGFKKKQVG